MLNGLLFVSAIIITASLHIYYELHPLPIYVFTNPHDINHFLDRSYFRTYVHVSTYCVGLTVGYILATRQKLKIPVGINLMGWLASILLSLSVVYGVYDWNQGEIPGLAISTLYTCTHKLVWALAIAWVTVSCTYGNGGIVTKILSWPAFVPLSRLTYMTYLVH
ncbi:Nose resistant to fluoxetine protein 6, partial [Stegodyphus mimosarum]